MYYIGLMKKKLLLGNIFNTTKFFFLNNDTYDPYAA